MIEIPATAFARRFAEQRRLAQREPVAITQHGQVTEVLLSKHEFDEYQRLKRQATRALWVHDLSNETLDRLAASTMDERHADLDALMAG